MAVVRRGSTYHLKRRVPRRYSAVEKREDIWLSLHTDSPTLAATKAAAIWQELIEVWEARIAGASEDAVKRYEAARKLAAIRGFRYQPASAVAALPLEDLLERIEAIPAPGGVLDPVEADALLGAVPVPSITIKDALDLYWTLARDKTLEKSPDQIRRWRNPHIKAVANLVSVIGNLAIDKISPDDMQDFRDWWLDKIEHDNLTASSANKDFTYIATILNTVAKRKRLGFVPPVSGLRIAEKTKNVRLPFSDDWIREKIVPGLGGMNAEARSIVLVMVNTGARPSEIAALTPGRIVLDAAVPNIRIEGEDRQLKSATSERTIPLVGVSLEAILPGGYPRYADNPSLSATVNKFMRENGIAETPKHTLYGLRHAFEDRLLAAGVDERIRRDLMGHSLGGRQRYGAGGKLEQVRDILQAVAI